MKTRLLAFAAALLLLPLAGFLLSGREWAELAIGGTRDTLAATALTMLALLCYTLLAGLMVMLRTGSNPLTSQRGYYLALGAFGAVLCWLLAWLNLFADGWPAMQAYGFTQILFDTLLFSLTMPAVFVTRAMLGSFRGLLKALASGPALPVPKGETAALALATLAAFGLLVGAALQQSWLLWIAPLPLLLTLQLLWHESTILDALREGDWGRLICAALSGLVVGNLAAAIYHAAGGIAAEDLMSAQAGFLLFGLLCLQLGDVIAEQWRGTTRTQLFKKKPFPIPVVKK